MDRIESQSQIYTKNKPSFTVFSVNSGFTTKMNGTFGDRLKQKMDEARMKAVDLSRRSGVTKQNIGRLLNNTPHAVSGAAPGVTPETVEKLAKALDWDLDDALLAAGYAPKKAVLPPELQEFDFSILDAESLKLLRSFCRFVFFTFHSEGEVNAASDTIVVTTAPEDRVQLAGSRNEDEQNAGNGKTDSKRRAK